MRRIVKRLLGLYERLQTARAIDSRYRFAVRHWAGMSDVDVMARLLDTEYFRDFLTPLPLQLETFESLLVIAPHQDDEAIGIGGTLSLASRMNVRLGIIFATDGEQGGVSATTRDKEAEKVCEKLGAKKYNLNISNMSPKPTLKDLETLAQIIHTFKPEVVLIPWMLDVPLKHRLITHCLTLTHLKFDLSDVKEIWSYQIHNTIMPNTYVDITEIIEEKRELLQFYESQLKLLRRYDHLAVGLSAWNSRFLPNKFGPYPEKYVELFFTLPSSEYFNLLASIYFPNLTSVYRGMDAYIELMNSLQNSVLSST